ncbi:MAG: Integral membrane protein, partial [uncultured Solirubrobacteraceae bacterium]
GTSPRAPRRRRRLPLEALPRPRPRRPRRARGPRRARRGVLRRVLVPRHGVPGRLRPARAALPGAVGRHGQRRLRGGGRHPARRRARRRREPDRRRDRGAAQRDERPLTALGGGRGPALAGRAGGLRGGPVRRAGRRARRRGGRPARGGVRDRRPRRHRGLAQRGRRRPVRAGHRADRRDRGDRRGHHRPDRGVPLRGRDGAHARLGAHRARGGDPPADLRHPLHGLPELRADARHHAGPRRGHRLRPPHRRPLPRAARPGGLRPPRGLRGQRHGRDLRGGRRGDRRRGHRGPAGHGDPVRRADGPGLGDRGGRRGRGRHHRPADAHGRLRAPPAPEGSRARGALRRLRPLGGAHHGTPVARRGRRDARPARPRRPLHRAAAGPARRRQRPRGQRDPRGLRPPGRGLRPGLQRAARGGRRHAARRARRPRRGGRPAVRGLHAGRRRRDARPAQRGGGRRHDRGDPVLLAAGRADLAARRAPARHHAARRDPGHGRPRLRRRRHRHLRGPRGQDRLAPAAVRRARGGAQRAAAHGGVPLPLGADRLRGVQPPEHRGGLRRRGGGVPERLGRRAPRGGRRGADRLLRPAVHVRRALRAEHGLQRLPPEPDPGGVPAWRRAARQRRPGPVARGEDHPGRRGDHDRRVPRVRLGPGRRRQDDRARARRGHPHRRPGGPDGRRARGDDAARRQGVVAARVAGPAPAEHLARGRAGRGPRGGARREGAPRRPGV